MELWKELKQKQTNKAKSIAAKPQLTKIRNCPEKSTVLSLPPKHCNKQSHFSTWTLKMGANKQGGSFNNGIISYR